MSFTITAKGGFAGISLTSATIARTSSQPQSNSLQGISNTGFVGRLEKHIDDVKHGDGNLSADVSEVLGEKGQETSALLANSDPGALKDYAAYTTLLGYDKNARYVNAIGDTAKRMSEITTLEQSKAATDELVKAFYPDSPGAEKA